MRNRLVLVVGLVVLSAPAAAHPDCDALEPRVFLAGDVDGFAAPPEPTSPSRSLIDAIPAGKPLIDFDVRAVNARLAHTFVGLPAPIDCSGPNTLEFRLRATGVIPRTDGLFLLRSDGFGRRSDDHWRITLSDLAGCTWGSPGCSDRTFLLDLCDLPDLGISPNGHDEVISQIEARAELEVDFQDDTMVDYLLLRLTAGSCERPHPPGYWFRQCLGTAIEPGFTDELVPCADARLDELGFGALGTCSALAPGGEPCARAQRRLAGLLLDGCAGRLGSSCPVDATRAGCTAETAGELSREVAALILDGRCRQAAACARAAFNGAAAPGSGRGRFGANSRAAALWPR